MATAMQLMDVARDMVADGLKGDVSDLEIKYVAVGDDDGTILPLASTNTTLGNETFRKQVTSKSDGGTGILNMVAILLSSEAVGTIEEVGFFAGATAGAGADTGILVSRGYYSKTKTALESIQFHYRDTITEA